MSDSVTGLGPFCAVLAKPSKSGVGVLTPISLFSTSEPVFRGVTFRPHFGPGIWRVWDRVYRLYRGFSVYIGIATDPKRCETWDPLSGVSGRWAPYIVSPRARGSVLDKSGQIL